MSAVLLIALAGIVAWQSMTPSPAAGWAVREWVRVLRFRFANRSFADTERAEAGLEDVDEVAPGVYVDGENVQRHVLTPAIVTGRREAQVGAVSLLNPPMAPQGTTQRHEVRLWIEQARARGTHTNSEINKQAAKRFGVSVRLAQLAAQDIGRRS